MSIDKIPIKNIIKSNSAKTAEIKIEPFQDNMIKNLCDMMYKNTKIDKKIIYEQFNKAIEEWQTITHRPLRDEMKMVPVERIRISKTILKILRDNLSDNLKGKKYEDQINRALDITLKYYEDNYAYRK